jgi:hypothetical protein
MDLVSSVVMLITSRMAARPSVYKYPVGRTRIETIGIIMFCCLMTTVAIQLIVSFSTLTHCTGTNMPLDRIRQVFSWRCNGFRTTAHHPYCFRLDRNLLQRLALRLLFYLSSLPFGTRLLYRPS